MNIDKGQILELLRSQGKHDEAQQADSQLPDQVDPQEHSGMLERFGLNPQDLIAKFLGGGGGGGGGGLGGALGGLMGGR